MQVIAEGIEGPDQFHVLMSSGCEYGQGFEIARPMDPDRAFEWLTSTH